MIACSQTAYHEAGHAEIPAVDDGAIVVADAHLPKLYSAMLARHLASCFPLSIPQTEAGIEAGVKPNNIRIETLPGFGFKEGLPHKDRWDKLPV